TLKTNLLASNSTMVYICEMDYVDSDTGFTITSKADYQIQKITNGVNTVTPVLSNENVTLPATSGGVVSVFTGSSATIQVYEDSTIQYLSMPSVFSAKSDGTYYASTFVINAFQVAGTGTATAYNGFIKIEASVKGDFTDTTTPVANTTQLTAGAYTWTVTAGI